MSSYLTFYLVPKKEKPESQEPLALMSFSRNSLVYQAFSENAAIAFIGNGNKPNYTEITKDLINLVEKSLQEDIKKAKLRDEAKLKVLKELPELKCEDIVEYLNEVDTTSELVEELEQATKFIFFINSLLYDIGLNCTDFKKILANID